MGAKKPGALAWCTILALCCAYVAVTFDQFRTTWSAPELESDGKNHQSQIYPDTDKIEAGEVESLQPSCPDGDWNDGLGGCSRRYTCDERLSLLATTHCGQVFRAAEPPEYLKNLSHIQLADRRVLVVGQRRSHSSPAGMISMIYDPVSNAWGKATPTGFGQKVRAMSLLPDQRVLVLLGSPSWSQSESQLYIFDPETNAWTEVSSPPDLPDTTLVPLPDGRVLLPVGRGHAGASVTSLIFDSVRDRWTVAAPSESPIDAAAMFSFPIGDSEVLIIGGCAASQGQCYPRQYDATTDTWSAWEGADVRAREAVMIESGQVLTLSPFALLDVQRREVASLEVVSDEGAPGVRFVEGVFAVDDHTIGAVAQSYIYLLELSTKGEIRIVEKLPLYVGSRQRSPSSSVKPGHYRVSHFVQPLGGGHVLIMQAQRERMLGRRRFSGLPDDTWLALPSVWRVVAGATEPFGIEHLGTETTNVSGFAPLPTRFVAPVEPFTEEPLYQEARQRFEAGEAKSWLLAALQQGKPAEWIAERLNALPRGNALGPQDKVRVIIDDFSGDGYDEMIVRYRVHECSDDDSKLCEDKVELYQQGGRVTTLFSGDRFQLAMDDSIVPVDLFDDGRLQIVVSGRACGDCPIVLRVFGIDSEREVRMLIRDTEQTPFAEGDSLTWYASDDAPASFVLSSEVASGARRFTWSGNPETGLVEVMQISEESGPDNSGLKPQ